MTPLPVLLSIPHGGYRMPVELQDRVCMDKVDLFDDGDAFTIDIYDLGEKVTKVVKTDIARAFIDLNRTASDRPPDNPDGVVKSCTCYGRPIYRRDRQPDESLTDTLLNRYYFPYHHQIKTALQRDQFKFALDCHSMAAVGPPISPDAGKQRPTICLGNVHGKTCSQELIARLANCFRESFELRKSDVRINAPFAGGYITRIYGANPIPWIQVEMSRALYLAEPWFKKSSLKINKHRLQQLNDKFEQALFCFFCT